VSASAFEEHRERCLEAGADDFLAKPFRVAQLLELLRMHLGLELIYADTGAAEHRPPIDGVAAPEARLVLPEAELANLLDLARRGHVRQILEAARRLEALDVRYASCAAEIRSLAERFQVKRLCQFLEEARSAP
jgi:hypothetical protein